MRTVFVGDVHGCRDELDALFDRVRLTSSDRVVFVGDLVARGPDSAGVVRIARGLGARSVVGNHDERLVRHRRELSRGKEPKPLRPVHAVVAASLDDDDWAYLEAMPLFLDVREHGVRVVHAGVVPGLPIDETPERLLLTMRTLDDEGRASDRADRGVLWGTRHRGPEHVIFGHHALAGLQLHPFATGLDTACVYGDRLSALVLAAGEPVPPVPERAASIVSVPARRAWFRPDDAP